MLRRIALTLVVLLTPVLSQAQEWVEHRPAGKGWRVQFPATPPVDIEKKPDGGEVYYGGTDRESFIVIHRRLDPATDPPSADPYEFLTEKSVSLFEPEKPQKQRRTMVSGAPALEVSGKQHGHMAWYLLVLRGDQFYMLVVSSKETEQQLSRDGAKFLSSFALLN